MPMQPRPAQHRRMQPWSLWTPHVASTTPLVTHCSSSSSSHIPTMLQIWGLGWQQPTRQLPGRLAAAMPHMHNTLKALRLVRGSVLLGPALFVAVKASPIEFLYGLYLPVPASACSLLYSTRAYQRQHLDSRLAAWPECVCLAVSTGHCLSDGAVQAAQSLPMNTRFGCTPAPDAPCHSAERTADVDAEPCRSISRLLGPLGCCA